MSRCTDPCPCAISSYFDPRASCFFFVCHHPCFKKMQDSLGWRLTLLLSITFLFWISFMSYRCKGTRCSSTNKIGSNWCWQSNTIQFIMNCSSKSCKIVWKCQNIKYNKGWVLLCSAIVVIKRLEFCISKKRIVVYLKKKIVCSFMR